MNILFLTISNIQNINNRGIYTDLLRHFIKEGHNVHIVSPNERKHKKPTEIIKKENHTILKVWTLNLQKTNFIEKGIGTILLEHQFNNAINKHFSNIKYDLILYSTPPITLTTIIKKIKKRDGAKTYLLLKDIFPQNAVDLEMLSKKSIFYKYFRAKERKLYELSDYIGCMSPANVKYVISHNKIHPSKVEVCPNSIELSKEKSSSSRNKDVLTKYNIPLNTTIYIYGGNLGKPQGIDFLLKVIESRKNDFQSHFIIVGSGTEYDRIKNWFITHKPKNATLISGLIKKEYDNLVSACDVGLIFLDKRFTIPNYPSRLLSYLENKLPIIAATDPNTDIGKIAETHNFGFACINGNLDNFCFHLDKLNNNRPLIQKMGENGYNFLLENYTVQSSYNIILKHFS